jgi:hypothetical protein
MLMVRVKRQHLLKVNTSTQEFFQMTRSVREILNKTDNTNGKVTAASRCRKCIQSPLNLIEVGKINLLLLPGAEELLFSKERLVR